MDKKGLRIIDRMILIMIAIMLSCGFIANGANYSTKSSTNPGYRFEEADSWVNGTPGIYNDNTFTVNANSNMTINGRVYLNGNINMKAESVLKISDNSTLIISGDFDISDKSKIIIGNSASLYVKGNFTTYDILYDYFLYYENNHRVYVEMNKFANLVIEKNFTSTTDANITFIASNNNGWGNGNAPDFYVFGDWSGVAYTAIKGLDSVEDEDSFNQNETTLSNVITTATASLDECALTVESGNTLLIQEGVEINVTALTIEPGAQLQNYGTINFVHTCNDDTPADFNITNNYYKSNGVDYSGSIVNGSTGIINCATFNYKPTAGNGGSITFSNEGIINADSVYVKYDENILFYTSCNSIINARSIFIEQDNGNQTEPLTLNGVYRATDMKIASWQGHIPIEIGSDCGDSDLHVTNLILNGNGSILNINELTGVDNIIINTQTTLNVDGVLILGKITTNNYQTLKLNSTENSILSLCYNPTKGDDNLDAYSSGVINGIVTYLGDENLTDEEKDGLAYDIIIYAPNENEWHHPSGTTTSTVYHVWEGEDTPASERDITLGSTGRLVSIKVSYAECLNTNPTFFLSIDDDPFIPKDKEIKFNKVYCEPCDKELERTKMQIRELGNRWFRNINGELIYCEGDNK